MWRESFLRRIREVREKEPQREIVYTYETWLNGGHRVKKEWVDLKALENPRHSIKENRTVGCTKDNVGKGKRIIIVDCITENGPVPGAVWIFSAGLRSQRKRASERNSLYLRNMVKWRSQGEKGMGGLKSLRKSTSFN